MANLPIQMPLIQAMGYGNQGYSEQQSSYILAQSGRPVILLSSGTFANSTGLMTGLTALPYVPLGIVQVFIFAGAGIPASGLYWAIFSSTTSCQLYTRFDASVTPTGITPGAYAGGTSEVTLTTIRVPGKAVGANGSLRSTHQWSMPSNVNNKSLVMRLPAFWAVSAAFTTVLAAQSIFFLKNRNTELAQLGYGSFGSPYGSTGNTLPIGAVDTTAPFDFTLTGQLAVATDFIILENVITEIFPSVP